MTREEIIAEYKSMFAEGAPPVNKERLYALRGMLTNEDLKELEQWHLSEIGRLIGKLLSQTTAPERPVAEMSYEDRLAEYKDLYTNKRILNEVRSDALWASFTPTQQDELQEWHRQQVVGHYRDKLGVDISGATPDEIDRIIMDLYKKIVESAPVRGTTEFYDGLNKCRCILDILPDDKRKALEEWHVGFLREELLAATLGPGN